MTQLHIAILDCDPLTSTICRKYGSYGGVIINWLQAGARSQHGLWQNRGQRLECHGG